jgi:SAM-dependent methyltransferase
MMRCPMCDAATTADADTCPAGHLLEDAAGVIRLLPSDLRAAVDALEADVATWRLEQGRTALPRSALRELPFGDAVAGDAEWKLRRADLRLVRRVIGRRTGVCGGPVRVLDIGAWNGWLAARLAVDGHAVTAFDLFAGPDALGARHVMPGRWRAVQGDPTVPERMGERFDVVILDRCLTFQPDPAAAVRAAAGVAVGGGLVIATGIAVPDDPELARLRLEAERLAFRARFGRDLLLRPAGGVADDAFLAAIRGVGMRLHDHPFLRMANVRAVVDRTRPRHLYGRPPVTTTCASSPCVTRSGGSPIATRPGSR